MEQLLFGRVLLRRLIRAPDGAECYRQTIPGVDRDNRHRQINKFPLIEMLACEVIYFIRNLAGAYSGDRLGPCQCGALLRREKRSLAPYAEGIQALLRFAVCASVLAVHVYAVGA